MTPIKHSIINGKVRFHYAITALRDFIKYAYIGCAGPLLWGRDGNKLIFKLSGTLEKPRPVTRMKDLFTMTMVHNDIFDGPMCSDDQRLIPPKPFFTDARVIFIDELKK